MSINFYQLIFSSCLILVSLLILYYLQQIYIQQPCVFPIVSKVENATNFSANCKNETKNNGERKLKKLIPRKIRIPAHFCLRNVAKRLRICLLKELAIKLTNKQIESKQFALLSIIPAIRNCGKILIHILSVEILKNDKDDKPPFDLVILPRVQSKRCHVLTIGKSSNAASQQQIRNLRPSCKFFGAIRKNIRTSYDRYQKLSTKSLYDLIDKTGSKTIDYLFLRETVSREVLPTFHISKWNTSYTVCQMTTEIDDDYNRSHGDSEIHFRSQIMNLISYSALIPIFSTKTNLTRIFWLNFDSLICIDKYLSDFCRY